MRADCHWNTARARPFGDRFWEKVDASGDCWEWTGYRTKTGYGTFGRPDGTRTTAHRIAWESLVGPIPDGHEPDHRCFNRSCVNPDHLEIVTSLANKRRARWSGARANAAKTHCPRGHQLPPPGPKHRNCNTCKREKYHERKQTGAPLIREAQGMRQREVAVQQTERN